AGLVHDPDAVARDASLAGLHVVAQVLGHGLGALALQRQIGEAVLVLEFPGIELIAVANAGSDDLILVRLRLVVAGIAGGTGEVIAFPDSLLLGLDVGLVLAKRFL